MHSLIPDCLVNFTVLSKWTKTNQSICVKTLVSSLISADSSLVNEWIHTNFHVDKTFNAEKLFDIPTGRKTKLCGRLESPEIACVDECKIHCVQRTHRVPKDGRHCLSFLALVNVSLPWCTWNTSRWPRHEKERGPTHGALFSTENSHVSSGRPLRHWSVPGPTNASCTMSLSGSTTRRTRPPWGEEGRETSSF